MVHLLGMFVAGIFALLSVLHVFWAFGGKWGNEVTVPEIGGKRAFQPSRTMTLLVAVALFLAMLVVLGQLGWWGMTLPRWIFYSGTWSIAVLFFFRAVGEFTLVGFFKRVRHTRFARWDTWMFSPLCLLIAMVAVLLVS